MALSWCPFAPIFMKFTTAAAALNPFSARQGGEVITLIKHDHLYQETTTALHLLPAGGPQEPKWSTRYHWVILLCYPRRPTMSTYSVSVARRVRESLAWTMVRACIQRWRRYSR